MRLDRVVVEGAGNSDANGMFVPAKSWHENEDKSYCSKCTKLGNTVIYHKGRTGPWYIHSDSGAPPYGRIPLYQVQSDSAVPLSSGWGKYGEGGTMPYPTVCPEAGPALERQLTNSCLRLHHDFSTTITGKFAEAAAGCTDISHEDDHLAVATQAL